jgi:hypothetical protein
MELNWVTKLRPSPQQANLFVSSSEPAIAARVQEDA